MAGELSSIPQRMIYDGQWIAAKGGSIDVTEKATGEVIGNIGLANADDVANAAAKAAEAQKAWANVPGPSRGDILRKMASLITENAKEISDWLVRETGSVRPKAEWEVFTTAREVLEAAAAPSMPQGHILATEVPGRRSYARRLPIGVAGVITPWNSPFLLAARAYGPALALGNAVVLKPDHQTPIVGGVIPAMLLEAAGLPAGLFQVVPGAGDVGEAVVTDPNIDMVSFTGSSAVGAVVGSTAGKLIKRVSLEMGGNNAFIVLDDADIDLACSAGCFGSFFHQGQICLTAGRHFVHEKIVEAYIRTIADKASAMPVGDPFREEVALGPIINEKQAARAERIVRESVEMGARIEIGGERNGLYFKPTVLSGVTPDMPAFKEEIFGPVAPIISVASDDEAVALANRTEYGLSAAIQSKNVSRAMAIADRLHSGIIHINEQTVLHEVYGPIGGVGASGNGYNFGTLSNADQFTELQWLTVRDDQAPYPF